MEKSVMPDNDHYMSMVKLGPKSQIVIPKQVREMFDLAPGDTLVLIADRNRGIALQRYSDLLRLWEGEVPPFLKN